MSWMAENVQRHNGRHHQKVLIFLGISKTQRINTLLGFWVIEYFLPVSFLHDNTVTSAILISTTSNLCHPMTEQDRKQNMSKTYRRWGPPSPLGDMEQLDWEPQPGLVSYPEEILETMNNDEETEPGLRRNQQLRRQLTVSVLTNSHAHSFVQVLRHQFWDPRQHICDAT